MYSTPAENYTENGEENTTAITGKHPVFLNLLPDRQEQAEHLLTMMLVANGISTDAGQDRKGKIP